MVAGAQQQPQPQQPVSAEEEALKRNTDCVYFLASPLTCKKGSECEYRHSDFARVNPRDCWYWLNSNCLNPKCAFRHPPVEGLLGTQAVPSVGSAPSSSHTAVAPPVTPATQSSSKQAVACIYFQKGYCMKADRCSFLHGPNPPTGAKPVQASASTQGSESSNVKKVILQKCSQEQKLPQANTTKSLGGPLLANPIPKVEFAPPRNGVIVERSVVPIKPFGDEHLRAPKAMSAPMINGIQSNRLNRPHQVIVSSDQGFQNGKDGDEFLRESSPGFDVLVEDELEDQEYFRSDDQYGRVRGHDGRSLNVDDYDMDQSADYGSAADVDRDRFRDPRGYESRIQEQHPWEQPRGSSDRKAVGHPQYDRRGYRKSNSPENINGSDLRHRLSKHRRVNGLRSVISHDNNSDDRSYRGSSRRDSHPIQQPEGPLRNRLRGRINFGSSANGAESRIDKEFDRGRSRGRLSPERPQTSTNQGRFRDRLKGRVQDDYNNEGRNGRDSRAGREITDDESAGFSGPKSLLELKGAKGSETWEQSILGKRKNTRMEVSQQPEGDVSFDGPKPLSEILKRKREAVAKVRSDVQNPESSVDKEDREEDSHALGNTGGEPKSASTDAVGTEDEKIGDQELEAEEGMIYDETVDDDQELEGDDQAQGEEYDYEQGEEDEDEEGEYDAENAEGEEEYLEDEDDDFAKKIGVLSS